MCADSEICNYSKPGCVVLPIASASVNMAGTDLEYVIALSLAGTPDGWYKPTLHCISLVLRISTWNEVIYECVFICFAGHSDSVLSVAAHPSSESCFITTSLVSGLVTMHTPQVQRFI